jgi:SAM-dependent methyltransferase
MRNTAYWNNEGTQKVFSHPIRSEWIADIDGNSSILDLGCGYGRLTPNLIKEGFSTIFGYDSSAVMIERAAKENPGASYTSRADTLADKTFDLILCFALFTSCPSVDEQTELVSLINGFARQNARVYISDYETRDNQNYHERYSQRKLNTYGCFASENAIFRHHAAGYFDRLFFNWKKLKERKLGSKTMNGNDITIHQYLYIKIKD